MSDATNNSPADSPSANSPPANSLPANGTHAERSDADRSQATVGKSSLAEPKKIRWRRWILLSVVLTVCTGGFWFLQDRYLATKSLDRARLLLKQRRDNEAELALNRYLHSYPSDPEGILMWAQAVVSGNSRTPVAAAKLAADRMQEIPDTSEYGAEARMREARLRLLILNQPAVAEQLLARSIDLNPDILDSHYLLWKLYDMTERFQFSEPHFWKTYELTPDELRAERLRDWYVSQFSPTAANAELDRHMGFLRPGAVPGEETDLKRLEEFYSSEPDSPMVVAALAQWYFRNRKRDEAMAVLQNLEQNSEALLNPFYVSTKIVTLLETGNLQGARETFENWPSEERGYDYWIAAGKVQDLVDRDYEHAAAAYGEALKIWPGHVDWSTMHRRAQCLARLGRKSEAEGMRQLSKKIELLMEPEVHQKLRKAMADLSSESTAKQLSDFYEAINRPREAGEWRRVISRLPAR